MCQAEWTSAYPSRPPTPGTPSKSSPLDRYQCLSISKCTTAWNVWLGGHWNKSPWLMIGILLASATLLPDLLALCKSKPQKSTAIKWKAEWKQGCGGGSNYQHPQLCVWGGEIWAAALLYCCCSNRCSIVRSNFPFSSFPAFRSAQPLQLSAMSDDPESGRCFHYLIELTATFDGLLR